MTRDQAYAQCTPDSYVEFYAGQWLVIPYMPVVQPAFFSCAPGQLKGEF